MCCAMAACFVDRDAGEEMETAVRLYPKGKERNNPEALVKKTDLLTKR